MAALKQYTPLTDIFDMEIKTSNSHPSDLQTAMAFTSFGHTPKTETPVNPGPDDQVSSSSASDEQTLHDAVSDVQTNQENADPVSHTNEGYDTSTEDQAGAGHSSDMTSPTPYHPVMDIHTDFDMQSSDENGRMNEALSQKEDIDFESNIRSSDQFLASHTTSGSSVVHINDKESDYSSSNDRRRPCEFLFIGCIIIIGVGLFIALSIHLSVDNARKKPVQVTDSPGKGIPRPVPTTAPGGMFLMNFSFPNMIWDPLYSDKSSSKFKDLSLKLKTEMEAVLLSGRLRKDIRSTEVISFMEGSIICEYVIFTKKAFFVNDFDVDIPITAAIVGDVVRQGIETSKQNSPQSLLAQVDKDTLIVTMVKGAIISSSSTMPPFTSLKISSSDTFMRIGTSFSLMTTSSVPRSTKDYVIQTTQSSFETSAPISTSSSSAINVMSSVLPIISASKTLRHLSTDLSSMYSATRQPLVPSGESSLHSIISPSIASAYGSTVMSLYSAASQKSRVLITSSSDAMESSISPMHTIRPTPSVSSKTSSIPYASSSDVMHLMTSIGIMPPYSTVRFTPATDAIQNSASSTHSMITPSNVFHKSIALITAPSDAMDSVSPGIHSMVSPSNMARQSTAPYAPASITLENIISSMHSRISPSVTFRHSTILYPYLSVVMETSVSSDPDMVIPMTKSHNSTVLYVPTSIAVENSISSLSPVVSPSVTFRYSTTLYRSLTDVMESTVSSDPVMP